MKHYPEMYHDDDTRDRTESLARMIPELFTGKYKSVLYIGARINRCDYLHQFRQSGYVIDIVEVFEPNACYYSAMEWIRQVYNIDIKDYIPATPYDVIFWWHGPEHVSTDDLPAILWNLEKSCKIIILGCPWGIFDLKPDYGNSHEEHISHLDYKFFEDRGYTTECLGEKDVPGSNITSVKITN